jgi:hypothetical protein
MAYYTIDLVAEWNPHLTREEIVRRAALTPEMLARIAASRADPFFDWLGGSDMPDDEFALSFVAADAAAERDAVRAAAREAAAKEAAAAPIIQNTSYQVEYVNERGDRSIDADFSLVQALQMANTLYTSRYKDGQPAWGQVSSVTIKPTNRPLEARQEIESQVIS